MVPSVKTRVPVRQKGSHSILHPDRAQEEILLRIHADKGPLASHLFEPPFYRYSAVAHSLVEIGPFRRQRFMSYCTVRANEAIA